MNAAILNISVMGDLAFLFWIGNDGFVLCR